MKYLFNDLGEVFLFIVGIVFLTIITFTVLSKHEVKFYYLTGESGNLIISLDINWQTDEIISLDRAITYEEAVILVEKLNKTLR